MAETRRAALPSFRAREGASLHSRTRADARGRPRLRGRVRRRGFRRAAASPAGAACRTGRRPLGCALQSRAARRGFGCRRGLRRRVGAAARAGVFRRARPMCASMPSTSKLSIEAAGRELRYAWFDSTRRGAAIRCGRDGAHPRRSGRNRAAEVSARRRHSRAGGNLSKISRFGTATRFASFARCWGSRAQEVEAYLTSLGQSWREDESNLDHRFARNRVRHELAAAAGARIQPQHPAGAERRGRAVASGGGVLAGPGGAGTGAHCRRPRSNQIPRGLKPACEVQVFGTAEAVPLQSPVLPDWLNFASCHWPAAPGASRFRRNRRSGPRLRARGQRCCAAPPASVEDRASRRMAGGAPGRVPANCVRPRPAQHPSGYECTLPIPAKCTSQRSGFTMRAVIVPGSAGRGVRRTDSLLSAARLGPELTVRNWRPGDRFWPLHTGSEEKLKRLFAEKHIPAEQRASWPVVLSGDQIVWVRGFPVAQGVRLGRQRRRESDRERLSRVSAPFPA